MKEYLKKNSVTPLIFVRATVGQNCVISECCFGDCLGSPLLFQKGQKARAPRLPGRFVGLQDRVGHILPPVVDNDFPACVHAKASCHGERCRVHGTDGGVHLSCPKAVKGMVQKECSCFRGIAHVPEPPVQDVADFQALLPEDGFWENARLADDMFLSLQAQGAIAELWIWKAAHALNPGEHVLAREGVFPGVHDLNVPHEGAQGVEVAFLKPAQEKPGRDKGLKLGGSHGLEHGWALRVVVTKGLRRKGVPR